MTRERSLRIEALGSRTTQFGQRSELSVIVYILLQLLRQKWTCKSGSSPGPVRRVK